MLATFEQGQAKIIEKSMNRNNAEIKQTYETWLCINCVMHLLVPRTDVKINKTRSLVLKEKPSSPSHKVL